MSKCFEKGTRIYAMNFKVWKLQNPWLSVLCWEAKGNNRTLTAETMSGYQRGNEQGLVACKVTAKCHIMASVDNDQEPMPDRFTRRFVMYEPSRAAFQVWK